MTRGSLGQHREDNNDMETHKLVEWLSKQPEGTYARIYRDGSCSLGNYYRHSERSLSFHCVEALEKYILDNNNGDLGTENAKPSPQTTIPNNDNIKEITT